METEATGGAAEALNGGARPGTWLERRAALLAGSLVGADEAHYARLRLGTERSAETRAQATNAQVGG